jgi:hypothetical protein
MMEISLAGLVGAMVGTILAAIAYGTLVDVIERWLTSRRSPQEPPASASELALLRRGVLAIDILAFAGLGYWIGHEIVG